VPDRTGVLVIRVWTEGDRAQGLRARITGTLDLTAPEEVSTTASSADEIEAVVHGWLREFELRAQTGA